jgi:hypothetical protein
MRLLFCFVSAALSSILFVLIGELEFAFVIFMFVFSIGISVTEVKPERGEK